jgi:amino acid adenylation domain-containing protein
VERSLETAIGILGILKAGGAYVPLDPAYPKRLLASMLEDTSTLVLLTQARLKASLPDTGAEIICLDSDWDKIGKESDENLKSDMTSENLAYVIYTSGSTGRPNGVAMPHRPLVNLIEWQRKHSICGPGFRTLQFASLSFDVSFQEIFSSWRTGGTVVLVPEELRPNPRLLWRFVEEYSVDRLFLPPIMLELLAQAAEQLPSIPESVREVITAGERLRITPAIRNLFERLPCCVLVNQYGPTEAHVVTAFRLSGNSSHWLDLPPIGKPIANIRLHILDEQHQTVPAGVPGELFIAGDCLARGYLKQPELTAERFIPGPLRKERCYSTGDLCRWGTDGNIEFLGRLDHQVKIRGYRIEAGEIEAALAQLPSLEECAVVARPNRSDKQLIAYFVVKPENAVQPETLRKHLEQTLPAHMVPSVFVRMEALPRTVNGKIDRNALPSLSGAHPEIGIDFEAPRSATERKLAAIWAEVLGVERVGVNDDFFSLGGQSLKATQILGRVFDVFGVELSHRSLFDAHTLADQAEQIDRIRPASPSVQEPSAGRVAVGTQSPLSWGQTEIWLATQFQEGLPVYNEPFTVYMKEPIDVAGLERAQRELVRRHSVLRTGFMANHGHPVQVIQDEAEMAMAVADLESLTPLERESKSLDLATSAARSPFDLAQPPLFRAMLVRMDATDYRLYLTFHHIIVDAYSVYSVFIPELWQLYESFRAGKTSPLSELDLQYVDYVRWQRERTERRALAKCRSYWRKQLADAPLVELPTMRPRPRVRSFRGAHHRFSFSKELRDGLNALSRRAGATLFMTLLAGFKTLLWRYTQADEIIVGSVEAGRSRLQFEQLLGYFLNTLVLRTNLAGNPTFEQLLKRVRQTILDAHAHREMPFVKLVEELYPARDGSRNPFFQVAFVMEPTMTAHESGWIVSQLDVQTGTAKFDLTVELEERDEGVIGRFEYSRDQFDDAIIRQMIEHYQTLLESAVANPKQSIASLPMLTEPERRKLFLQPQARVRERPSASCIHELFEAQVERTPSAIAVSFDDQQMTYRDLNDRANQLARGLRELGVGPEALVAICVEPSLEMVIGILGILKAGGAYVPLDPMYPEERLRFLLEDVQAPVLVTQKDLLGRLPEHNSRVVYMEEVLKAPGVENSENPGSSAASENLAYVIYTSGSTGRPKGVMLSHHNVVRLFTETEPWFHFGREDVWTLFHSYAFDFSVWELWGALLYGGRLVVVPHWLRRTPEKFYQLLEKERITVLSQTPSAFRHLLQAETSNGVRELALRWIIFGGEALELASLKPWFDRHGDQLPQLVNMYGITETTVHVTYRPLAAADLKGDTGSVIGKPIPDLQAYLLDGSLQPVPVGALGEIYVGGEGVARGYLNRPDLTEERFIPNPFTEEKGARLYKSGDLARFLPNGELEYLGRSDDQVKIRGVRIEPGEIMAALGHHPSIRETVVTARKYSDGDIRLVAYLVPNPGASPRSSDLRSFLRHKLPDYMIPTSYVFLDAIPLTPNGKLHRQALPDPFQEAMDQRRVFVGPRTLAEEMVANIWREVLGIQQVSVEDSFFELGGHSLSATQVISRLRDTFAAELPIRSLFENPTVASLATAIVELCLEGIVHAETSSSSEEA